MLIRYGKDCDMRKIKRSIPTVEALVLKEKKSAITLWDDSFEEIASCRVCGCTRRKFFLTVYEKYNYYECENCGMLYLANNPKYKTMYVDNYDTVNGDLYTDESIWYERIAMIAKPKVDFVLDVCRAERINPKSWIDIGCGGGEILYSISKYTSIECLGLEPDKHERAFAEKKGIHVIDAFLDFDHVDEELNLQFQSKDVVSLFNVLELMENPVKAIDYLWKAMKKGSVLVIESRRHPSAASFANLTAMGNIYRHMTPPNCVSAFSEKSMNILLEGKFRLIGKWGFGQGYTDMVNNAMLINGRSEDELYLKMLECNNSIQKIFDEAGLSDAMIYVAIKE